MPANLTPQYYDAERRYKSASSPQDKLDALKFMLSEIPKHKGTEKLQGDIKKKIAKTKSELQKAAKHGPKAHSFHVKKEGAGQVALIGAPNVGKSSLVCALTHAKPEIANYPFTTRQPCPGMMNYENIKIQLVDLPPVSNDYMEYWVPNVIRNADLLALIVDLSSLDPLEQVESIKAILESKKMKLVKQVSEETEDYSIAVKKTIILGNKFDANSEMYDLLAEMLNDDFALCPTSVKSEVLLNQTRATIFDTLRIVRVYSKPPGKHVDQNEPFILHRGSTLSDLAILVHREIANKLRFARVWGTSKYDGQRVNRDYELMDGDVIELHV
jgi:uncharacterized protein